MLIKTSNPLKLAKEIKILRKKYKITQLALAEKLWIHNKTLSRWEKWETSIWTDILLWIMKELSKMEEVWIIVEKK